MGHFVSNPDHIKVLTRGLVPVDFYIVLSGFMTHYAYSKKSYDTVGDWGRFVFRRIARIAASVRRAPRATTRHAPP